LSRSGDISTPDETELFYAFSKLITIAKAGKIQVMGILGTYKWVNSKVMMETDKIKKGDINHG